MEGGDEILFTGVEGAVTGPVPTVVIAMENALESESDGVSIIGKRLGAAGGPQIFLMAGGTAVP